jgi:fatty acid desaturase
MKLRRLEIALHGVRLAASVGGLCLADARGSAPLVLLSALGLYFEGFSLLHDLAHGALGLRRAANEAALSFAGLLLLTSGHAMRRMHLLHHALHLGPGDLEGEPANVSLVRAIAGAPVHAVRLRVSACRRAGPRGRRLQLAENAGGLILCVLLLGTRSPALVAYALVTLAATLTAGVWASHLPHHTPAWLVTLARALGRTGSPTILALAYHDAHHARPGVPTTRLRAVAAELASRRSYLA